MLSIVGVLYMDAFVCVLLSVLVSSQFEVNDAVVFFCQCKLVLYYLRVVCVCVRFVSFHKPVCILMISNQRMSTTYTSNEMNGLK